MVQVEGYAGNSPNESGETVQVGNDQATTIQETVTAEENKTTEENNDPLSIECQIEAQGQVSYV